MARVLPKFLICPLAELKDQKFLMIVDIAFQAPEGLMISSTMKPTSSPSRIHSRDAIRVCTAGFFRNEIFFSMNHISFLLAPAM